MFLLPLNATLHTALLCPCKVARGRPSGTAHSLTVPSMGLLVLKRNERRLEEEAEQALPGPVDAPQSSTGHTRH